MLYSICFFFVFWTFLKTIKDLKNAHNNKMGFRVDDDLMVKCGKQHHLLFCDWGLSLYSDVEYREKEYK